MIIALGHKSRVGKDTIGEYLEVNYKFKRISFAYTLKEAVKTIYGWNDEHVYGSLKEVIDPYWNISPREVMQKFGTEACRNVMRDDIWVKSVVKKITSDSKSNWVITDARFKNEASAIKDMGGFVVKVDRQNRSNVHNQMHPSEIELLDYTHWDQVIDNNKDYKHLFDQVDEMVSTFNDIKLLSTLML